MIMAASKSPVLSRRFVPEPPKPTIEETIQSADGTELRITVWYGRRWPMIHELILSGRKPVVTVLCLQFDVASRLAWLRDYATKQPLSIANDSDEIEIITEPAARVIDTQLRHGHRGRLYGGRIGGAE